MFRATKSLNSTKVIQMSPEDFGAINAYLLGHGAYTPCILIQRIQRRWIMPLHLYHVHGRSLCQSALVAYLIMSLASISSQWDFCPHHWAWGPTETYLNIQQRHLIIQWFEFISSIITCSYTSTLRHHLIGIQMKTSSSGKAIGSPQYINQSTNRTLEH